MRPVRAKVAAYYSEKVRRFGTTALGADWACPLSQELRFVQLLKVCGWTPRLSLNDYGCGYGALIDHLDRARPEYCVDYVGVDLSAEMIARARERWRGRHNTRFVVGYASPQVADYSVASGIFNVSLHQSRPVWEAFVADTLHILHRTSAFGFAVNFIEAHRRHEAAGRSLYSTEPGRWARYCAAQFGAVTEVIDDYGLPEFTLLVRRRPAHRRPCRATFEPRPACSGR